MSIWNIVEYKPRAPQAQGNLQSAYLVENDRIKPDLAAGFRVQHSDQNQYPNNSFLFLENAARLPQMDPYAWGDKYENILQVKEDYNRGIIPTLDCLSVRQQSQVSADGVPTNPPPPSQPVEPTPLTQTNSNHGGALKTEQKNANHENKIEQADEKKREIKSEQDMLDFGAVSSVASVDSKRKFSYGDIYPDALSPVKIENKEEENETKEGADSFLQRTLNAISYAFKGKSASKSNEFEDDYKDSLWAMRQNEREEKRLSDAEIVRAVQIEFGKVSDQLRRDISKDTSLNQGAMMNKISEVQDIVKTYATELGTIVAQVDAIERDMYASKENQKSILNELSELRNQFLNIANRRQDLEDELKTESQNARRLSGADLASSNVMQNLNNITTAINTVRENNAKDLNALSDKMNALEAALAEKVIKLDSISTKLSQTVLGMQSNFVNESKTNSDTINSSLNFFQQAILREMQNIRIRLDELATEMKGVSGKSGQLSIDNQRMYEELSAKFTTFLESASNIMAHNESRIVSQLTPYLARTNLQGQEISLYDLAAQGFQNLVANQITLSNANDDRYSNIESEFKSLEKSLKSLNTNQQYTTIQQTLNEIKGKYPELVTQLESLQTSLTTYASQLDQSQADERQADPLNYNVTDLSYASNSTNPFVKKRKSVPTPQGQDPWDLDNKEEQETSRSYFRSGGGAFGQPPPTYGSQSVPGAATLTVVTSPSSRAVSNQNSPVSVGPSTPTTPEFFKIAQENKTFKEMRAYAQNLGIKAFGTSYKSVSKAVKDYSYLQNNNYLVWKDFKKKFGLPDS